MRMAITDRAGADASALQLHLEDTPFDRVPPLGYPVCAIGLNGWRYIGPVIATDEKGRTYTILPVPSNSRSERQNDAASQ